MGLLSRILPIDWFELDPEFFPKATQDTLSLDFVKQYGALALGTKKGKILNIGLLEPRSKPVRTALEKELSKLNYAKFKVYRIRVEGYLNVLHTIYGITAIELTKNTEVISPVVTEFMEQLKREKQRKEAEESVTE